MESLLFRLCAVLHLVAALVWLGHMFFWSVFSGSLLKKIRPAETGAMLRQLSMHLGGTGWPALGVLGVTGAYMIWVKAPGIGELGWMETLRSPYGTILAMKLSLVALMLAYQVFFGHRPAPRAIFVNMLVASLVLVASVFLARV